MPLENYRVTNSIQIFEIHCNHNALALSSKNKPGLVDFQIVPASNIITCGKSVGKCIEKDSQLTIIRGSTRSAPPPISILLSLPPHLALVRQQAFDLPTSFSWTADEYRLYWLFVDNLLVHNHTNSKTKKNSEKSYWYCRLWKNDADQKSDSHGRRAKRMRLTDPCPAVLIVIKQYDEANQLALISLARRVQKSETSDEHNHTLQDVNDIKINSALKLTAGSEVAKGYRPAVIKQNMQSIKFEGKLEVLKIADGASFNLLIVHNVSRDFKKAHPDQRLVGANLKWEDQLNECVDTLQAGGEDVLIKKLEATRLDGEKSFGIAFAKRSRLRTLMRRGHLTFMDFTHNANSLKWNLFTLMIRDEYSSWLSDAHMHASNEDGDLIDEFLRQIKQWTRGGKGGWRLRCMFTDDSAAEQRGMSLTFRGLAAGEMEIAHLLCRMHSERTPSRKLSGSACSTVKKHLYDALYFRKTQMGCDDSINRALKSAPVDMRDSIHACCCRSWSLMQLNPGMRL